MSNGYMFEAQPRPVQSGTKTKTATKAKYRDPADTMSDTLRSSSLRTSAARLGVSHSFSRVCLRQAIAKEQHSL